MKILWNLMFLDYWYDIFAWYHLLDHKIDRNVNEKNGLAGAEADVWTQGIQDPAVALLMPTKSATRSKAETHDEEWVLALNRPVFVHTSLCKQHCADPWSSELSSPSQRNYTQNSQMAVWQSNSTQVACHRESMSWAQACPQQKFLAHQW